MAINPSTLSGITSVAPGLYQTSSGGGPFHSEQDPRTGEVYPGGMLPFGGTTVPPPQGGGAPPTPVILYETPEERAAFLEERKQKLMETQVGYVPGMGAIYGGSTGMGSNYYDASGNPITKDMVDWGTGRHGELMMPEQYNFAQVRNMLGSEIPSSGSGVTWGSPGTMFQGYNSPGEAASFLSQYDPSFNAGDFAGTTGGGNWGELAPSDSTNPIRTSWSGGELGRGMIYDPSNPKTMEQWKTNRDAYAWTMPGSQKWQEWDDRQQRNLEIYGTRDRPMQSLVSD